MTYKQAKAILEDDGFLLVKVDDKHEPYVYLVESMEDLRDACFAVIKNRLDWYAAPEKPKPPAISREPAAALPEGRAKAYAIDELEWFTNAEQHYAKEVAARDLLKAATEAGDGHAAFRFLTDRRDYEYEGIEFERAEVPPEWRPFKVE